MVKKKKSSGYTADAITVLKGLEAVRQRPAMYVGSTDKLGLHQIFYEVLDNAVDEALAGYANVIIITYHKDGYLEVADNGRGIPVDIHPVTKKTALETVMTTLHAGGKFDRKAYKISGGLHGVGVSATNALSEHMVTIVRRDGAIYKQEYKRGIPQGPVKKIGTCPSNQTGTTQKFKPDPQIFKDTTYNLNTLKRRIREQAFLTSGVFFIWKNLAANEYEAYFYKEGLLAFLDYLSSSKRIVPKPFYVKQEADDIIVEVALTYTQSQEEKLRAFANNIHNREGGTHVTGFKTGITNALNQYASKHKILKGKQRFSVDDIKEGLVAVVSVKLADPQYEGQTKLKLNNPEARTAVYNVVSEAFLEYLEKHPKIAKTIINRILLTKKAKEAAKAARRAVLRKSELTSTSLPGKLADCSTKDPSRAELFIVEGDSAGGSAKQARDRETQAILPLTGKPVNPEKNRLDKVLGNPKINDLVKALGIGVGENMDLKKLRYNKIIIMTDADVDGMHIVTLLLTFFYRYMRPLIEKGYIYVAQPPLYKVEVGNKKYWFLDKDKMEEFVEQVQRSGKKIKNVQRFKGLGEMNPEQLWETTMNPKTRVLKRVTIEDAEEADKIFRMFMGEEVGPRREFILKYARFAELDV